MKTSSDGELAIRDYKDLRVWQKAMDLAQLVYQLTRDFPPEEKFGIVAQMRRAAVSVPSNLAEGQARNTRGEFVQFISHAEGSLAEVDTQVRLSERLGFCVRGNTGDISTLTTDLQKMLNGIRGKLTAGHDSVVRHSRTTNH